MRLAGTDSHLPEEMEHQMWIDMVEEKFGEQNFRVLSEMRILAKIRVAILDFGRVCRFFSEIWREFRF